MRVAGVESVELLPGASIGLGRRSGDDGTPGLATSGPSIRGKSEAGSTMGSSGGSGDPQVGAATDANYVPGVFVSQAEIHCDMRCHNRHPHLLKGW